MRLLALASGGGHWVELLRTRPEFEGWDVAYVSTLASHGERVARGRYFTVPDATRMDKAKLLTIPWQAIGIVSWVRPHAVVTTGSAPGLIVLLIGRLFGARTS